MKPHLRRAVGACLNILLFSDVALGATAVSWTTLPGLFRQRFKERAPERFDAEAAAIGERLGGGFHLDPVIASSLEKTRAGDGRNSQTLTASVTQGSPYGTELSVRHSEVKGEAVDGAERFVPARTNTLTLSQKLLKNGPLMGSVEGDAAATARALADLKVASRIDELLLAAFTAYASVEEAGQVVAAARRAQAIALEQSKAVEELVKSGYKPKADLLVSTQATVRAELQVAQASQRADQAHRTLDVALFQEPADEPLAVTVQEGDDTIERRLRPLKGVAWSGEPPKLMEARLNVEAARLKEKAARRDDWPSLAVSASIERVSANLGAGFDKPLDGRTLGVTLSVPLVAAIRRDNSALAGLQLTKAEAEAARAARELADSRKALEEKKALSERALSTTEKLEGLAARTLTIEQQKYADGKSTIAEVRRLQEESDSAAQSVFSARKNLLLNYLEYAHAAGLLGRIYP